MRTFLLALIHCYQWCVRPLLPPSCRFHPSCSCYAQHALQKHGAWHGTKLTVKRLLRCHPWNAGGYDPVPDTVAHHHCHSSNSSLKRFHG